MMINLYLIGLSWELSKLIHAKRPNSAWLITVIKAIAIIMMDPIMNSRLFGSLKMWSGYNSFLVKLQSLLNLNA